MAAITQAEFNDMLQTAIAQGLPGGYIASRWSWEEVEGMLDQTLEWYDLPLTEKFHAIAGYAPPMYTKTAFGLAIIAGGTIQPVAESDYFYSNPIIARLPEGYRPLAHVKAPAVLTGLLNEDSQKSIAANLDIQAKGGYIQAHSEISVRGRTLVFPTVIFPAEG